jgi:hypothetical protein
MSAPASSRVPSPRELVYRLATATGLTAPQIGATLDGDRIGCHALERCVLAAERIGVELPAAPRRDLREGRPLRAAARHSSDATSQHQPRRGAPAWRERGGVARPHAPTTHHETNP